MVTRPYHGDYFEMYRTIEWVLCGFLVTRLVCHGTGEAGSKVADTEFWDTS